MQSSDVMFIPKRVRIALLGFLFLSAALSVGLTLYFALFVDRAFEMVAIGIGAAQASVTGIVIVALVSFSLRMRTTNDVQRDIDDFFLNDLCLAMRTVAVKEPKKWPVSENARTCTEELRADARVETDFCRGKEAAYFWIKTDRSELKLWIMVNVYRVTVIYYFDGDRFPPDRFEECFRPCLAGAEASGYSHSVICRENVEASEAIEVHFTNSMKEDFIHDPAKKLFLRNDLRQMTASILYAMENAAVELPG